MTRSLLHRLAVVGLGLHLLLVASVVSHASDRIARREALWPLAALINYYSAVTFTNRNFGFFAPDVTPDWNTRFVLTDAHGAQRTVGFAAASREMAVKLYSLQGHFSENEENMDLFARSWAVKLMSKHRDAVKVDVEVSRNYLPSMAEYRRGLRMQQAPYYRTSFTLR